MTRNMYQSIFVWTASLVFIFTSAGCSYSKYHTVLSRREAIQDLEYLVKNVIAIHPDPFTRISEEEFNVAVDDFKNNLSDQNSRKDFSLAIAELLALLKDDHTRLSSFPDFINYCNSGGLLFPVALRYKEGKMKIVRWVSVDEAKRLTKGDTIVAINGRPMDSLVEQFQEYVSAETEWQKSHVVAERFHWFLWLAGYDSDHYELDMLNKKGEKYRIILDAVKPTSGKSSEKSSSQWSYSFYKDGEVCFFKIASFSTSQDSVKGEGKSVGPTYQSFVNTVNKLVSECKNSKTSVLIVDLRGNGGGSGGLGQALLKRTVDKPFHDGSKKWRYSKAYQKALLICGLEQRKIPAWLHLENVLDLRKYKWGPDDSQLQGEYQLPGPPGEGIKPHKNAWKGNLVIVTDHNTASAAVYVTAIVKDNKLGLIVGEETGGRASYFAEIAWLLLPNSGLYCVISSAHFLRPAGYDDGRGVLPDLPLDVTIKDDLLVEKVYRYIKNTYKSETLD